MLTKIDHFYWVSSASNNPGVPAWHVQVIDIAETMEEVDELGGRERGRMLNVAQAIDEGFDLSAIAETLNVAALARCTDLEAEIAEKATEIETLTAAIRGRDIYIAEQFRTKPITRRQFFYGLQAAGLLDTVSAFFVALPDDAAMPDGSTGAEAKERWNTALYFSPQEPLLIGIAKGEPFNLTDEQVAAMMDAARLSPQ